MKLASFIVSVHCSAPRSLYINVAWYCTYIAVLLVFHFPQDKDDAADSKERKKAVEAVAKHLRFSLSVKEAQVKGKKIEYFSGSKAVDCLMSSKWTQKPKDLDSYTPYFTSRSTAVDFCTQYVVQSCALCTMYIACVYVYLFGCAVSGRKQRSGDPMKISFRGLKNMVFYNNVCGCTSSN